MKIVDTVTEDHILWIDMFARAEDRTEWEEALGEPLIGPLRRSLSDPHGYHRALVSEGGGACYAIWGCHDTEVPGVGQIWFVATNRATEGVHKMHSVWAEEIGNMHARWPLLLACTHQANHLHHVWMERRGFVKETTAEFGPNHAPYFIYNRSE